MGDSEAKEGREALEAIVDFMARSPIEVKAAFGGGEESDVLDPEPRSLPPRRAVWMRTRRPLGQNQNLHKSAAAFLSDLCLLPTALLPHRMQFPGLSAMKKLSMMASLDHSMWFHSSFRADEWMLYDMDSPRACGNRALVFGKIYSQAGILSACVAQEGLIRRRQEGDERSQLPV